MKSLQVVLEGLEQLYHFTHIGNLIRILEKDQWMCSENDGLVKGAPKYYISFTRSQNASSGYPSGLDEENLVKIVFNERKLHSKFKIKSITFQKNSKNTAIKGEWEKHGRVDAFNTYKDEYMKQTNVEAEDRLFSNKQYIRNISKYIDKVIINGENCDEKKKDELIGWLEKRKVPHEVAPSTKEFNNLK